MSAKKVRPNAAKKSVTKKSATKKSAEKKSAMKTIGSRKAASNQTKAASKAVSKTKAAFAPSKSSVRSRGSKPATKATPALTPAEVSHRLHALLHTIHQIERYEERLCSMQDAIKRSGKLSAPLLRDLHALLEEIPSGEYQHDLDAVRDAVLA